MALPQVHLGHRQRMALRYAGIAVAALVVFVLALQATFPYERIKDKAIEALANNYDVTIGSVDRGFMPGSVTFKAVSLRTRPTRPDEVPTMLFIDSIHVDLGLWALIGMTASVDLDVKLGVGRLKGTIALPKFGRGGFKIDLAGTNLPGKDLPLRSVVGLPVIGKLDFSVRLSVPTTKTKSGRQIMDWTKADGDLSFGCPTGCTLGDGKTKLKPLLKDRSKQALVADGIDFGKLDIDSLAIEATFTPAVGEADAHSSGYKPGKFDVTKFDLKSKDGELHVDYSMTLAPELDESMVAGCLRFNVSENLLKTDEGKKTYAAVSTSGAEKRSDGLFHIHLTDHLKDMKRLNQECGPNAKPGAPGEGGTGMRPGVGRPTIHVQPPEPRVEPPHPVEHPGEPHPGEPHPGEPHPGEPPPHPEPPPGETAAVPTTVNSAALNGGSAGSAPEGGSGDTGASGEQQLR